MDENKARRLAKYEIGWWRAHHHKNSPEILENMAKLYSEQFNLPYDVAKRAAGLRVQATRLHDIAEKLEDEGKIEEAEKYWREAENQIASHFRYLPDAKQFKLLLL